MMCDNTSGSRCYDNNNNNDDDDHDDDDDDDHDADPGWWWWWCSFFSCPQFCPTLWSEILEFRPDLFVWLIPTCYGMWRCTQLISLDVSTRPITLMGMTLRCDVISKDTTAAYWKCGLINFRDTSKGNMPWAELSWWRHQMETFSTLLVICAGNSPVSGEVPAQRLVTRSFDVFFDLCPINDWVNNREAVIWDAVGLIMKSQSCFVALPDLN